MSQTMELLNRLSYEQIRALRILIQKPDIEGSALCAEADCSWGEMFDLAEMGLIDAGMERLQPNMLHPVIAELGRKVLAEAEA